jgi:flavorubredoxin
MWITWFASDRRLPCRFVATAISLWLDAGMIKRLLIVYHSQSGASWRLAAAARHGALREEGVAVIWRRAWDAGLEDLVACDGLLLVAAENSGNVSGAMKDFLDRTFYPALPLQLNRPYGLVVAAGNDGRGASAQMQKILSGYPMKLVAEPLICRGEVTGQQQSHCEELGQALAAGLSLGIY